LPFVKLKIARIELLDFCALSRVQRRSRRFRPVFMRKPEGHVHLGRERPSERLALLQNAGVKHGSFEKPVKRFASVPTHVTAGEIAVTVRMLEQEIEIGVETVACGHTMFDGRVKPRKHRLLPIACAAIIVFRTASGAGLAKQRDHLHRPGNMVTHEREIDMTAQDQIAVESPAIYPGAGLRDVEGSIMPEQILRLRPAKAHGLGHRERALEVECVRQMKKFPMRKCKIKNSRKTCAAAFWDTNTDTNEIHDVPATRGTSSDKACRPADTRVTPLSSSAYVGL